VNRFRVDDRFIRQSFRPALFVCLKSLGLDPFYEFIFLCLPIRVVDRVRFMSPGFYL